MIAHAAVVRKKVSLIKSAIRARSGNIRQLLGLWRFLHLYTLTGPFIQNWQPFLAILVANHEMPIGFAREPTLHLAGPSGGSELPGQFIEMLARGESDLRDIV